MIRKGLLICLAADVRYFSPCRQMQQQISLALSGASPPLWMEIRTTSDNEMAGVLSEVC